MFIIRIYVDTVIEICSLEVASIKGLGKQIAHDRVQCDKSYTLYMAVFSFSNLGRVVQSWVKITQA